jgi:putative ABC transport system permease protein
MNPRTTLASTLRWWAWLALGQWRAAPARAAVSVCAVAIGVALALAIHLVNASALEEFRQAIATVNGDAHAHVRARTQAFDERVWADLAQSPPPGLAAISPVLESELVLAWPAESAPAGSTASGRTRSLKLMAIDPFAAAGVTPGLLPQTQGSQDSGAASDLFDPDAVFLSQAALDAFGLRVGDPLPVRVGLQVLKLRIAGTLPGVPPGQALAVMDLGSAQWRLGQIGHLTRIDLRFEEGVDAQALQRAVSARLPADTVWNTPEAAAQRMSNVSRAYRVNLNVLAGVALFTGAFLVFATMALSVARQQGELALMGVLGASRGARLGAVLLQGALLGAVGAALGMGLGIALAKGLLQAVGGDLGGGYFSGSRAGLLLDGPAILGFGGLGLAVGILGALAPAWVSARMAPARALRSGSSEESLAALASPRLVAVLAIAGAALLWAPAIGDLPLGAYGAIALWLLAGIACVPLITRGAGRWLSRLADTHLWQRPAAWLAITRLAQSPGTVAAGLAGVVASFALACAMAIMVSSFRTSVAQWLDAVLPADIYARAPASGAPPLDEPMQHAIAAVPGVQRADFLRTTELSLDPLRPAVALLIREIEGDAPWRHLPLTGASLPVPQDAIGIWVSEPMLDRYRLSPGQRIDLPIGTPTGATPRFFVAGVWRDYARQHGALAMSARDWQRLTGEQGASDVALWLAPGTAPQDAIDALIRAQPALTALEWRSAAEIRALSLRIFDRSFAVTYALEAIAIAVGLFGVAASCAGDALARAREFGMLRHVGVRRRQIVAQMAIESALSVTVAVIWGGLIGAAIGLVLIKRVNPQSFHWTMDVHWPLGILVASGLALIGASVLAALAASRTALGAGPLQAVRQDW